MSTPTRSPLAETGEFPDDEVLLIDIVGTGLAEAGLIPAASRVDTDTSELGTPAVTLYAPPARSSVNRIGDLKTAFIYADFIGADRDEAKTLADVGGKLLRAYSAGGIWKGVQVHRITEITTPTELPLRYTEDPRHRESGWNVLLRPHRGPTVHP